MSDIDELNDYLIFRAFFNQLDAICDTCIDSIENHCIFKHDVNIGHRYNKNNNIKEHYIESCSGYKKCWIRACKKGRI